MNVTVIGATGQVGTNLVRELLKDPTLTIVATGRNTQRLRALYRQTEKALDSVNLDTRDEQGLKRLYEKTDVVINCTGPSSPLTPARTAIEASLPYMESGTSLLTEPQEQIRLLDERAQAQGTILLTGAGVLPGLSRVLLQAAADTMTTVDKITIAAIFNDPLSRGSALDMLLQSQERAAVLKDREWISLRQGSQGKTICFPPPFHTWRVYAAPPLDTRIHFPGNITNFSLHIGTSDPLSSAITLLHSISTGHYTLTRCMARELQYQSRINRYFIPHGCALRMDASGSKDDNRQEHCISLYHPDTFLATAKIIAHGADLVLKDKIHGSGLYAFGEVVDPQEMLVHLRKEHFFVEAI
jgi:hypothetical protein